MRTLPWVLPNNPSFRGRTHAWKVDVRYGSIWLPPDDCCDEEDFLGAGVSLVPLGQLRVVSAWFGDANDPEMRKDITKEVSAEHLVAASQRARLEIPAVARRWGDPASFRLKQLEVDGASDGVRIENSTCGRRFAISAATPRPYHGAMASPGDMVLVPVMQLRFTHDKIRPIFRKGKHRGQPLYELVNDLFRGVVNPAVNLPPLEIYFHKGVWRSLNNRRLWALKAYMGLSGNFQLMVRAFISTSSPAAFREKNTTHTEGLSVEVNGDEVALQ
ncbi:unnamed protein product, partial [Cladocopium goreaui]